MSFATLVRHCVCETWITWNQEKKEEKKNMENLQRPHWLYAMQCQSKSVCVFCWVVSMSWCRSVGRLVCRDMMNANGFAIYANLMLTMYYSRPQAICTSTYGIGTNRHSRREIEREMESEREGKILNWKTEMFMLMHWGVKCWKSSFG